MAHFNFRNALALFSLPLFICAPEVGMAQDPETVDVDLRQSTLDANSLDVFVRANGQPFGNILSGLTFTLRWPTTSPATLGARVNACPDAINISATPQETNPLLNDVPTGFNYRTYNAFGLELLSDWGCSLPQDEWYLVMTVPVENNTGCTVFNIVNDDWTNAPGNARDFFVSLGGNDHTGVIEPTPAGIGDCAADCQGVVGGPALPGTPCDDGDEQTINDTWGENCVCAGELNTGIHGNTADGAIAVWPNPTTGPVYIRGTEAGAALKVRVSDALGRVVVSPLTRVGTTTGWMLDLSDAPSGLYLIESESKGTRRVERVVKR